MTCARPVSIPRIIMQTWKTHELPDMWKPTQTSINRYMPDWKYVLMSDEDNREFVAQHFPDFLTTYDSFPYNIQRADAVRYCWLYVHGGLYLDCDFELQAPIDSLFTQDSDLFLLASSNRPDIITNGFMAARPGHPIWLEMLEEMKLDPGLYSIERHLLVMNTTGPLAFNRVVKRSQYSYIQLPSELVNPCTICDTKCDAPHALLKPLEGSSWVGSAAATYQWCYCHSTTVTIVVIVLFLILLGLVWYYWMWKSRMFP